MRRIGNLFDQIMDRDVLREAVRRALRGKRSRNDARAFTSDLERQLAALQMELMELQCGDIALGEHKQFMVYDPKQRLITAPVFRERVLHHAILCVCEPYFERWLIDDICLRVGSGRIRAVERAFQYMVSRVDAE